MALDNANPVVSAFQNFGAIDLVTADFVDGKLPSFLALIESFLCLCVYEAMHRRKLTSPQFQN